MTLQVLHSELPVYEKNLIIFFVNALFRKRMHENFWNSNQNPAIKILGIRSKIKCEAELN